MLIDVTTTITKTHSANANIHININIHNTLNIVIHVERKMTIITIWRTPRDIDKTCLVKKGGPASGDFLNHF